MSATLEGRRVDRIADLSRPGDYCVTHAGALWALLPSTVQARIDPARWSIEEHEDRTVTVSPSIHDAPHGWHGYLERGVWRSV